MPETGPSGLEGGVEPKTPSLPLSKRTTHPSSIRVAGEFFADMIFDQSVQSVRSPGEMPLPRGENFPPRGLCAIMPPMKRPLAWKAHNR